MRSLVLTPMLCSLACVACIEGVEVIDTDGNPAPSDVSLARELWAKDPLRQTLDLRTGEYGRFVRDGRVLNRNSDIGFGLPNPGVLEVGIQGREAGVLVDLGDDAALAAELGSESGFAALAPDSSGRFEYEPANAIFDGLAAIGAGSDGDDEARVVPAVGHVLVGAVVDEPGSADAVREALLFKAIVVDHRPDLMVSIRWTVWP